MDENSPERQVNVSFRFFFPIIPVPEHKKTLFLPERKKECQDFTDMKLFLFVFFFDSAQADNAISCESMQNLLIFPARMQMPVFPVADRCF